MKTIHWAMIGTGDVTEKKSGPGFYKAKNSVLYGVTNRTLAKAEDYAKRHHVEKVFASVDDLLADPKVDAVYIATPPGSHKDYALRCAEAGKVCYIEKPIALTYNEALEISEAFKKANVKAFVAYYRRTLPRFTEVKALLDAGTIGDVRFVNVAYYRPAAKDEINGTHWHVQPEISGGGIFMDMAVHTLDILDFFFGAIEKVAAFSVNQAGYYAPEDNVALSFAFDNHITGTGNWCFTTDTVADNIQIVGSKGEINFGCFTNDPIQLKTAEQETAIPAGTIEHVHQNLIQTIVNELNGQGSCPSTIESALRTAWVCDQVYQQQD